METCRITVGPVWARLEAPSAAVALVREQMRALDPRALHTWSYKNGRSDGMVDFTRLGPAGLEFASGLVWRVSNCLKLAGLGKPEIVWAERSTHEPLTPGLIGIEWRPYQTEASGKMLRVPRICLQMPPRTGKTELGIEYARALGGRTLWVTHTDDLSRQTAERFEKRLGITPLVIRAGRAIGNAASPITVGMVQSLHRIVDDGDNPFFTAFDNLIMDEAHHAGAETWQKVANACTKASRRLGLSGTMATGNIVTDLRIEGALGPTHNVSSTAVLVEQQYLAKPLVKIIRVNASAYPDYESIREKVAPGWRKDPQGILGKLGGELYRESYQQGIIDNKWRNRAIMEIAIRHAEAGDRFLMLCNRVPHAIALGTRIESLTQKPVWVLNGGVDVAQRVAVLAAFKAQDEGGILIATPFFREGVDLPQVDAGMMAGGGASDIAVWQGFCRMLTVREGKKDAIVYDFQDGAVEPHEKDYLANNYYDRLALYERHGCTIERIK